MCNTTKIWLTIAAFLVLIGCIVFWGVMTVLKWDFTKLSTVKYETNSYEVNEAYKNITIVTETADVLFVPSENEKTSVVCHEQKNGKHLVTVQDNALVIEVVDTRKWYEYIGINFGAPKITVYIPQGEYSTLLAESDTGDVEIPKELKFKTIAISESTGNVKNYASASEFIKIKTSTGNILVENISVGELDLSVSTGGITVCDAACEGDVKIGVSTGKANLTDVACKNLTSRGDTGDISLRNVIAAEKIAIERSTGDVKFDSCDAADVSIETDTGNVTGTFLSEKVFIVETDTGKIDVPRCVTGGSCEITTDTGDIRVGFQ